MRQPRWMHLLGALGALLLSESHAAPGTAEGPGFVTWREPNEGPIPLAGPASGYPPDYSGQWTQMK